MCVSALPACLCEDLLGTQRPEVDTGSPGTGVTGQSNKYSQLQICLFSVLYLTPKHTFTICLFSYFVCAHGMRISSLYTVLV